MAGLTDDDLTIALDHLRASVQHEACWSCECLQAYLVQLQLDAPGRPAALIQPLVQPHEKLHRCSGCDPCPPADALADYLRGCGPAGHCCPD